jgi:hypothetical protein
MDCLTLTLNPIIELTDKQFFQLCQQNELIRFERNADGGTYQEALQNVEVYYAGVD